MQKGYWIGHLDVSNIDAFRVYQRENQAIFAEYGARYLVRGGKSDLAEGRLRSSHVVIEFPDYNAAVACYYSPEYTKVRELRRAGATADVVIVEGYGGPQPG